MSIVKGAEPYLLPAGGKGVLLLHGFTGSPAEMRMLGDYLHERNFTVLAVRLPGHGTCVEDLDKSVWREWYQAAEDGYYLLRELCSEVSVVGISLGALLALHLAARYSIEKVVAISTPIRLYDKRAAFLPVYRLFRRYLPKKQRHYNIEPIYNISYDKYPLAPLASLMELLQTVKKELPEITEPVLLIQSRVEHTVIPDSATYIYEHIGSSDKDLLWLDSSGHMAILGDEREKIFSRIHEFIKETQDE